MKRYWPALLALALAGALGAQADDAQRALRKAGDALEKAKTLSYDSVITVYDEKGQKTEYAVTVRLQKPNQGRIELTGPKGKEILVADGKRLWQEVPAEGGYQESSQPGGAILSGSLGSLNRVMTDPFFGSQLYKKLWDAEEYALEEPERVGEVECLVVSRIYGGGLIQKSWIGKEDFLIRKRDWWSRFGDEKTLVMSEARGNVKRGEALAAETFAYKPSPHLARIQPPAPDFEFTTIDGKTVKLSALRGKVVLISFFGTW